MNGDQRRELIGVIYHQRESTLAKSTIEVGEAMDGGWRDGKAVKELESVS